MTQLKQWVVALIAASFVGCIYHFLIPQKHFSSVLKLAVTAFFVAVMVLPFLPSRHKLAFDSLHFSASEESGNNKDNFVNNALINAAAERVRETIESALSAKHFIFTSVAVSMYIDENNSISINEITIEGVEKNQRQALYDYLKKKFDLEVTVK